MKAIYRNRLYVLDEVGWREVSLIDVKTGKFSAAPLADPDLILDPSDDESRGCVNVPSRRYADCDA